MQLQCQTCNTLVSLAKLAIGTCHVGFTRHFLAYQCMPIANIANNSKHLPRHALVSALPYTVGCKRHQQLALYDAICQYVLYGKYHILSWPYMTSSVWQGMARGKGCRITVYIGFSTWHENCTYVKNIFCLLAPTPTHRTRSCI